MVQRFPSRSSRQRHGAGPASLQPYPSCPLPRGGCGPASGSAGPSQPLTWEELLGQR